ncbi:MAG: capsule biosynthesis protein [Paracoccaceae bacterium]|nr:capsule biosynthesis protein [Paracoccaceae bacterium]
MAADAARIEGKVQNLRVAQAAAPARPRQRHWGLLASFLLLVLTPLCAVAAYLWGAAEDQYESTLAFSVRQEEAPAPAALFGAFAGFAAPTASDSDVLYAYLDSQDLVARIDARLDLRGIYGRAWPGDPVFAFDPAGTIEDLARHWRWMTLVAYDPGTGLIELRVRAFDALAAQAIAHAVLEESTDLINGLSEAAREDATGYAEADLADAVSALAEARERLTAFRAATQIVDPGADLQGRMGLLAELQARLADELIRVDLLELRTRPDDPRLNEGRQVTEAIEARIAAERRRLGAGGLQINEQDYARTIAEFSRLAVDVEIAEEAYAAARAARDLARAEARRQSRYLAAHIRPTRAERSTAPHRPLILGVTGFFLLLFWALLALVYYSLKDRRPL